MNMLNRFSQRAALCGSALLLCFSLAAGADELQDISKLFKQGNQEEALTRVNTYLEHKPKDAQARFLKGLILTEQGKAEEAIKAFTSLTEDFPELPEPYNNLAVLYANQGQYDKARIALEMAIRTNPSYATAHENLGDIYAKMASQAYDRALQLDHGNATTQTKLAMIKELFASGNGKDEKAAKPSHKTQVASAQDVPAPAEKTVAPSQQAASSPELSKTVEPAKVAEKKPAAHKPKAGNSSKDVLKMVDAWAAAWSVRDVKGYLAFYADDFELPGKTSRANWEAQREDRIRRPKSIKVGISHATVKLLDDSHASVTFRQSYHASHLRTSTTKTLVLVNSDNGWQIKEERAGK